MHEATFVQKQARTPRAVAGILFAPFYGAGLVLIRLSVPAREGADTIWLETNSRALALAFWVSLIFPGWVLAVSVYVLFLSLRE